MKIDMRDAFFERLTEVARDNDQIVVLSADHAAFALTQFEKEMPERYINVGIAEQNMVGVAAGLAASGKIVFVYGISPFVSLRVLEQLTIDVAAMQLPVNVVSFGAGFTYSTDGPTHQGLQDLSAVLTIPGITILNSSDPENTRAFVDIAVSSRKPHYIRIEKESLESFHRLEGIDSSLQKGFSLLREGENRLLLLSTGRISHDTLKVASMCEERLGLRPSVIDLQLIKPLPEKALLSELKKYAHVITIEESYLSSLGGEISKIITKHSLQLKLSNLGIDEKLFFQGASRKVMLEAANLSLEQIYNSVKNSIEEVSYGEN